MNINDRIRELEEYGAAQGEINKIINAALIAIVMESGGQIVISEAAFDRAQQGVGVGIHRQQIAGASQLIIKVTDAAK